MVFVADYLLIEIFTKFSLLIFLRRNERPKAVLFCLFKYFSVYELTIASVDGCTKTIKHAQFFHNSTKNDDLQVENLMMISRTDHPERQRISFDCHTFFVVQDCIFTAYHNLRH